MLAVRDFNIPKIYNKMNMIWNIFAVKIHILFTLHTSLWAIVGDTGSNPGLVDLFSDSPSVDLNPHVEPRAPNLCWNKYTFFSSRTTVWHDCVLLTDNLSLGDGGRTSGTAQVCKTEKLAGVSQHLWTVHNTHCSAWSTFYICNLSWQRVIKRMRRCWIDQR